jgi:hypothetical protein
MSETPPDFSNPQFGLRDYATAGLTTAPVNLNLGLRDQTGLQAAFATSPILNGQYTANTARETFQNYTGQNTEFAMYRRDFIPQGDSRPEYQSPRVKVLSEVEIKMAKLGSAFSPTIASPGAGEGFNYEALSSVRGLVPLAGRGTEVNLNPADAEYRNIGATGAEPATGTVRTFKLGVGSVFGENRSITRTPT